MCPAGAVSSRRTQNVNGRRFLLDISETIRLVLEKEDTDGDFQVRAHVLVLPMIAFLKRKWTSARTDLQHRFGTNGLCRWTVQSDAFSRFEFWGTWMLSVLLQELALASCTAASALCWRSPGWPVSRLSR